MHPHLTRLGISPEIQAFFEPHFTARDDRLVFPYGDQTEQYAPGFHLVPNANQPWSAGNPNLALIQYIFICPSAMEAISYLSLNHTRYRGLHNMLFLSTGLIPKPIFPSLRNKQIALISPRDLTGALSDIRTTGILTNNPVSFLFHHPDTVQITVKGKTVLFETGKISLSRFEKHFSIRSGIRTFKPKTHTSWLKQIDA